MGGTFSALYNSFFEKKQVRVLMLGLDGAGKTTILYKLKFGEVVATIPEGFNVKKIEYKEMNMLVWDICGQPMIYPLWEHYYAGSQGLIFVVDTNDRDRLDEATMKLRDLLEHEELRDAVVSIMANKQDLPDAMSTDEIEERFSQLNQLRNRNWHIQSTSTTTGEGLQEGFDWLSRQIFKLS